MLVLTRKEDESLIITPAADIDPATPIGEVFTSPITITLNKIASQVRIGIEAPAGLLVVREEIQGRA